jgi:hypothetical protein
MPRRSTATPLHVQHRTLTHPFGVDPAGEGVRDRRPDLNHWLFTLRVSQNDLLWRFHPGSSADSAGVGNLHNCRI